MTTSKQIDARCAEDCGEVNNLSEVCERLYPAGIRRYVDRQIVDLDDGFEIEDVDPEPGLGEGGRGVSVNPARG